MGRGGRADTRDGYVHCRLHLDDVRDLAAAVQRCRRMLDLDADPVAIADQLGADTVLAKPVLTEPGRRLPGHVDGFEIAVRAVLGQQVSVAAARTLAGRIVARHGAPLGAPLGAVTHLFPRADALAEADLDGLGLTGARIATIRAGGRGRPRRIVLDPGVRRADLEAGLVALPGIGPWTAGYVAMRALSDPDVFLPSDLGVRRALGRPACPPAPPTRRRSPSTGAPWRSYALVQPLEHVGGLVTTAHTTIDSPIGPLLLIADGGR